MLDHLRDGVEQAIAALGSGFLAHPANASLRDRLRGGQLGTQDYYRQVLRIVYRLIVLFVAEDRDLLFHPEADVAARTRYTLFYSMSRLRHLAEQAHWYAPLRPLRWAATCHGEARRRPWLP